MFLNIATLVNVRQLNSNIFSYSGVAYVVSTAATAETLINNLCIHGTVFANILYVSVDYFLLQGRTMKDGRE